MGKKKRERVEKHKQSLGDQIENPESYGVRTKPRPQKRRRSQNVESDDEGDDAFVPGNRSGKILDVAREQQREIDADVKDGTNTGARLHQGAHKALTSAMQQLGKTSIGEVSDSDTDGGADVDADGWASDPGSGFVEGEWEEEIRDEDEAALVAFMAPNADEYRQKTLSDVIMERIREKQEEAARLGDSGG